MQQDVPQPLFEVTMLLTSYSQSSPTATKTETVDIQDYCGLGYGLVMLHKWHTLSLSTRIMNFERQNLQHHSHLSGSLLMHGKSHASQQWAGPKISQNSGAEGLWQTKAFFSFIFCC